MTAVVALPAGHGLTTAVCAALAVSRASVLWHRAALTAPPRAVKPRAPLPQALPKSEQNQLLAHLCAPCFADQTPTEDFASLLDEGTCLCGVRTMYRILTAQGEVAERRRERRHPICQKPELLAEAPNQVSLSCVHALDCDSSAQNSVHQGGAVAENCETDGVHPHSGCFEEMALPGG